MVELVLVDFYPRKVLAPYSERRHVPDILRALVRYAHAERGIRPERTAEVEEAIDRWTPEFLEAIGRPAPSPTERARQAAEIALRGMREPTMAELMADLEVHMVDTLGGPQRSAVLDDAPLPDRPFDWSGTTPEQEPFLHETLRHIDRVCEELFDAEVRTIARAVLACVNEGDSQLWTRSPRPDAVAGAVVWLAERTGGAATIPDGPWDPPTQKRIAEVLGIRPALISDRIGRFERLIDPQRVPQPEMWHSARRRHALQALRDVRQWRAEHTDG